MTASLQAIEFKTTRIAEIEALVRERRGERAGSVVRGTITACREPGTYVTIVELPSGTSPVVMGSGGEAARLLDELTRLCDEPPKLYSLGVPSLPGPRRPSDG
ncbi:MAG TPA: hypothetical protein VES21_08890 [Nocardioidaceae bacterium]|nr:hypothetical protein [Nocardioidaceae bacterium]